MALGDADLDIFLADFGDTCVSGGVTFIGILDSPAQIIALGQGSALSTEYELSYKTSDVTLNFEDELTINGMTFRCRENPRAVSDGKFSRVQLKKV
jgi:hypothetical protein